MKENESRNGAFLRPRILPFTNSPKVGVFRRFAIYTKSLTQSPCWDFVGKYDKAMGFVDIKTGRFLFGFDKAKWKTRTVDIMEKCKTCPYCFICRGGCASRAEYNTGNCFREDCGESKEIFNSVASLIAGTHWQEHHEEELSLSLAGPLSRLTEKERETIMTTKSQKEIFDIAKSAGIIPEKVQENF